MYCNQCGRPFQGEGTLCPDCQAAFYATQVPPQDFYGQQGYYPPQPDPYYYSTEPEPYNRMFGFGKALASTLMAIVGFIFSYIAVLLALFGAGLILTAISAGLLITSAVFGIQSIFCFKRRKATCAKNIPTLVLGIYGTSTAGFASIYMLVALLVSLAAMTI